MPLVRYLAINYCDINDAAGTVLVVMTYKNKHIKKYEIQLLKFERVLRYFADPSFPSFK